MSKSNEDENAGHILRNQLEKRSYVTRQKYEKDPNICLTCGEAIPFEKRANSYCNSSCFATLNNKGVVRVQTKNDANCANCGIKKEKRHNKYCDTCIADVVYNKAQSLDEIKSDRHRRHFLIRTRGHRCEGCGLSEWREKEIPLELDHIDGNPDNNIDENLRLLCPNCHAQTQFYKGAAANRGKGRHSIRRLKRRKRYEEGKSY
jgi:hypothetical protein